MGDMEMKHQTLHNNFHTIPTSFLTCHLS